MAMIGSSIGLVFAVSMVAAPLLYALIGMSGLFWLTAVLAALAIGTILFIVPAAPPVPRATGRFVEVLGNGQLMRLNFGVFALHLMQTAMWVLVPAGLVAAGLPVIEHWKVYLPAVLLSFVVMVPAIIVAEKKGAMKQVFNAAIALLLLVQVGLYFEGGAGMWPLAILLTLFFVAFNVLEATQPSWISKIAPAHAKGTALGVYNTLQSAGLFIGGALGGWLAQHVGPGAVSLLGCGLAIVWLILASGMSAPPLRRVVPA
jgi:MFS family permease